MAKPAVFLDSSVIIASLLSTTGGSFYIISTLKDNFDFQTNEYGLAEIQRILKSKFAREPGLQNQLFLIFGTANITVLPNQSIQLVKQAEKYISKTDAPILASALRHSDYLITLDNEFLQSEVINTAKKKRLVIFKPRDFIEKFRII